MYHTVEQGEYLSSIARKYGFPDYKVIWDDANNAELKKKRQNPNVLYPGDELYIPDKDKKQEPGNTEKRHTFQLKQSPLELRLVLENLYYKPIANARCDLHVENQVFELTTDSRGRLQQEIPATAEKALLVIHDPDTPLNETAITLKIGHLDPVEEISGQKARLQNLGYLAGSLEDVDDEESEMRFKAAVEEFQCDEGLKVNGICDPKTQAKLKKVHGC